MAKRTSRQHLLTAVIVIGAGLLFLRFLSFSATDSSSNVSTAISPTASHGVIPSSGTGSRTTFAPDFSLASINTPGVVTLSDFRDEKPVILSFWASWCHNCQRNMPVLNDLSEKYKDKVQVIGVNLKEPHAKALGFLQDNDIKFPNVIDTGKLSSQYGIRYTNTHFLINKEGKLIKTIPGDVRETDFLSLIQ